MAVAVAVAVSGAVAVAVPVAVAVAGLTKKITQIFKQPKNREDGSKFDDFWTKSIASARTIFEKFSNE